MLEPKRVWKIVRGHAAQGAPFIFMEKAIVSDALGRQSACPGVGDICPCSRGFACVLLQTKLIK